MARHAADENRGIDDDGDGGGGVPIYLLASSGGASAALIGIPSSILSEAPFGKSSRSIAMRIRNVVGGAVSYGTWRLLS